MTRNGHFLRLKPFRDQDLLDADAVAPKRDRQRRVEAKGSADLKAMFEILTAREEKPR